MATVGLDCLYYATITEDNLGYETFGTPEIMAKAIDVDLSIELAQASLFADDGAAFILKEFKEGKLTLGTADLSPTVIAKLTGARIDDSGVLVSASEDGGAVVAIGFRARKPEDVYKLYWLYKVKFGVPSVSLKTKGESIEFSTPKIEGSVMRRNRPDSTGRHPWKVECVEGDPGVSATIISGWFNQVYESPAPQIP